MGFRTKASLTTYVYITIQSYVRVRFFTASTIYNFFSSFPEMSLVTIRSAGFPHLNPNPFVFDTPYRTMDALKGLLRKATNVWISEAYPVEIQQLHCHAHYGFDFLRFSVNEDKDLDGINCPFYTKMLQNLDKINVAVAALGQTYYAPLTEDRTKRTRACCNIIGRSLWEQRNGGASSGNSVVSKRLHITVAVSTTYSSQ